MTREECFGKMVTCVKNKTIGLKKAAEAHTFHR